MRSKASIQDHPIHPMLVAMAKYCWQSWARNSEGFFAFSDHCTHKGGPLSDGALIGCTVQCPWHGSQFDIRSGRVVAGPAQEKIKVYSVRISDGEVYVQSSEPVEVKPRRAA
jgi:nitrite reductase/ring-hydroxylating ferredoxin subunit